MDCWEDRMAHRAATRRMLREAEAWANQPEVPTFGATGFEWGTSAAGDGPYWPNCYTVVFPISIEFEIEPPPE